MMIQEIWGGDWKQRVRERARSIGCATVGDFVRKRPGRTYPEPAGELGADVAPIQITRLHLAEAIEDGAEAFREAARDALVRFIRERLPAGWNRKPAGKEEFEQTFLNGAPWSTWATAIEEVSPEAATFYEDGVWERLKANAPDGWLPTDANDEVICRVFDEAWAPGRPGAR